jgi:hypothetical protein
MIAMLIISVNIMIPSIVIIMNNETQQHDIFVQESFYQQQHDQSVNKTINMITMLNIHHETNDLFKPDPLGSPTSKVLSAIT